MACVYYCTYNGCMLHMYRDCPEPTLLHLSSTQALAVPCRRHRALSQVKSAHSFSEYAQLPAASQRHSCQHVPCASGLRQQTDNSGPAHRCVPHNETSQENLLIEYSTM